MQRCILFLVIFACTLPGATTASDDVPFFDFCERQPIVRIPPVYPPRAVERGIEGYTLLDLHVDVTGSVSDATVIEAEPSGIFDRASIRAVLRWKYAPLVIDGNARAFRTQARLVYRLDDDSPVDDPCSDGAFKDGFEAN